MGIGKDNKTKDKMKIVMFVLFVLIFVFILCATLLLGNNDGKEESDESGKLTF